MDKTIEIDSKEEHRVRRFPIGFSFDGKQWVAAQTVLSDLEPLRLVVAEPSIDAVLRLRYGVTDLVLRDWAPASDGVHSHSLNLPSPLPPRLWAPGTLATIEVVRGSISGAAFVTRQAGAS